MIFARGSSALNKEDERAMAIYLVCYDIEDNRERSKVARALLRHGKRVQYSVFELHRMPPQRRKALASELAELVSEPASVRFYRLTVDALEDSTDLTGRPIAKRPAIIIV